MEPAAEFLTPPTSFISVSFTTEVRALHGVVSERQVSFLYCGEILALPNSHREGVALTEEVTVVAIPKIVGVMTCGVLLCLGLSGASAAEGMKANHAGERIGGQAGRGYEHVNRERVTTHTGERIGGQAGWGYEQTNRERIATQ